MANYQDTAHTLSAGEMTEFCPKIGRAYEGGSGALSRAEQTTNFLREAAIAADMPKEGKRCLQTGRALTRQLERS